MIQTLEFAKHFLDGCLICHSEVMQFHPRADLCSTADRYIVVFCAPTPRARAGQAQRGASTQPRPFNGGL
jgi:hypothetical protein